MKSGVNTGSFAAGAAPCGRDEEISAADIAGLRPLDMMAAFD